MSRVKSLHAELIKKSETQPQYYNAGGLYRDMKELAFELEEERYYLADGVLFINEKLKELKAKVKELEEEIRLLHEFNDLDPEDSDWRYNFKWWKKENDNVNM